MKVLCIDPGREKCGLALVENSADYGFKVLWQGIEPRESVCAKLRALIAEFQPAALLLGDATTSRTLAKVLGEQWPQMPLHIIDETGSTLAARDLFWQAQPPRGWRRLCPLSLQNPPCPIDDFAAIVLAQRWFQGQST